MTRTRAWTAGTAAICVLLAVGAWFLLVGPVRTETSDLQSQKVSQDAANDQARLKIQQLKAQYAELPTKQAELKEILTELPDSPALPTLVRSLTAAASSAGVSLTSVSPGVPVAATTSAGPARPTGAAATPATPGTAKATTGLYSIPLNVQVSGSYAEVALFLQKLQAADATGEANRLSRAVLVSGFTLNPAAGASAAGSTPATGNVDATITGQVFVLKTGTIPTVTIPSAG
jgi:Tfp pilus assembly protein PilO